MAVGQPRHGSLVKGIPALLALAIATAAGPVRGAALPEVMRLSSGWHLQDAAKVQDKAEVISTADYQPKGWHKATVPGTVLTSLVNDGVYPEPLYGENNRPDKIPESLARTT